MITIVKNKLKQIFSNKTIVACILLTLVHFISGYWKWLEIGVSVIAFTYFIILPLKSSLNIFAYLHCFTISNIGYDSCFTVTMVAYVVALTIKYCIGLKKSEYQVYKKLLIAIGLFLMASIIISLPNPMYGMAHWYLWYLPLFYLIFAMRKQFDITEVMNYMLAGMIVSFVLAGISLLLPAYQYNPLWGNRFTGMINQPNYTYMRALFILTYFMYRYLDDKLSHLKFGAIYLICAIMVLLTMSKFGIGLLGLFTLIFCILYLKKNFKQGIKVVGIIFAVGVLLLLACHKIVIEMIERFTHNNGDVINSLLTGRDDIWVDYLKACCKNPFTLLFGNGLLTQEVYINAQQTTRASHNFYIFLLYRFGVVGCLALVYIIYLFIKNLNKQSPKFIAALPLMWLLFESLCENTFKCYNITYFMFAGMILFQSAKSKLNINQSPAKEENKEDAS